MKSLSFTKMSGAGNDFIICEHQARMNYVALARKICDRSNGIGADGLIILCPSRKTDYRMRIINADGSEAEMCGNGARCLAAYIARVKKLSKKQFGMETLAGIILAEAGGDVATIRLSEPKDYRSNIKLSIHNRSLELQFIDTGVPHVTIFVSGLEEINVDHIGRAIRFHKTFAPKGTNVNFVEILKPDLVDVRTYERGVEAETRACGTGSVASALMAWMQLHPQVTETTGARMRVKTRNGDILNVTFDIVNHTPTQVWLKGPARFVAQGIYFL